MKNKLNLLINSKLFSATVVLVIAMMFFLTRLVWGWTSPSGAPPTGSGAIYYSGGNVSIGTATIPAYSKLNVYDSSYATGLTIGDTTQTSGNSLKGILIMPYSDGSVYFDTKTISGGLTMFRTGEGTEVGSQRTWLTVDSTNGNVGVGMSPSYRLDVSGDVRATSFLYSSDISLKNNIETIPNALSKVLQLNGVKFNWKGDGRQDIGFVAQEVEKILPEIVHTDSVANLKSVEYANLTALLIEAIKEQQAEIDNLKEQLRLLAK